MIYFTLIIIILIEAGIIAWQWSSRKIEREDAEKRIDKFLKEYKGVPARVKRNMKKGKTLDEAMKEVKLHGEVMTSEEANNRVSAVEL